MSMIKIISPGSQDFSEPVATLVKVSSRGLRGVDLSVFEKRAGAVTAHEIAKIAQDLRADEPLVHLLAIGATEDYGANRNGDGFRRAICQQYHPTFQKLARWYRNHQNKNKAKSYGQIKHSSFHDPMKRIELAVALNGSEEAARRNGGLYADEEMEKLARGEDIPVSMACRVSHDVCSYCKNAAASREEYCESVEDGGHCKAGGLKKNIGVLVEIDGGIHHLHADNPDPGFFDISKVHRPADRIAYTMGILKAAGQETMSGAELAEVLGVTLPYELLIDRAQPNSVQRMLKLAYQLAEMEADMAARGQMPYRSFANAFEASVQASDEPPPPLWREKIGQTLRALADARIALPMEQFLQLVAGQDCEKAAALAPLVQQELPGVYSRLLARGDLPERVVASPFVPGPAASPPFRLWATKQAQSLSLREAPVRHRVTQAALRSVSVSCADPQAQTEKSAAERGPAARMAEEYGLYKIAFLGSIPESDDEMQLTASMALLQNYVS
jgi:hypothetical protein